MDELRKHAYRVVLSAGLLHMKWDLACWYGGLDPHDATRQGESAQRASFRAFAFHNLAIHAAADFAGFSEDLFWRDFDLFHRDCPDALCPYREFFDRCLRSEPVDIVAPDGVSRRP
jgi:hypothetical protein